MDDTGGASSAGGIALAEASLIVIEDVDIVFESDTGCVVLFCHQRQGSR